MGCQALTFERNMKICIWRYLDNTRNYPGYHLSADAAGCREIRQRLSRIRGSAVLSLTAPDAGVLSVPNNQGGCARYLAGRMLQVQTSISLSPDTFRWEEQDTKFFLTCSREKIAQLLAGVADIEKGAGDYSIRGESGQALWFWWQAVEANGNENCPQPLRGGRR